MTLTSNDTAAREAYLNRLAKRSPRPGRRGRSSTRVEALVVVVLGLGLVAFPWNELNPSRGAEAQPLAFVPAQTGGQAIDTLSAQPPAVAEPCEPAAVAVTKSAPAAAAACRAAPGR